MNSSIFEASVVLGKGTLFEVSSVAWRGHLKRLTLRPGPIWLTVPRSACVGTGDQVQLCDATAWVICHNGRAQILQPYTARETLALGGLRIEMLVKEITELGEHEAYSSLAEYHYREHSIHGRTARLIVRAFPYGAEMAYRARARTTLGVLTQLVAQAERYVVIAAPFIYPGGGTGTGPLTDAIRAALQRGVSVDVVSTGDGLQAVNAKEWRLIARGQLRLLQPRANIEDERRLGSHAKFCVADGWHAYIGSANLTGPGLMTNLEMGMLVHGELAHQVSEFWHYLCEVGFFVEVG